MKTLKSARRVLEDYRSEFVDDPELQNEFKLNRSAAFLVSEYERRAGSDWGMSERAEFEDLAELAVRLIVGRRSVHYRGVMPQDYQNRVRGLISYAAFSPACQTHMVVNVLHEKYGTVELINQDRMSFDKRLMCLNPEGMRSGGCFSVPVKDSLAAKAKFMETGTFSWSLLLIPYWDYLEICRSDRTMTLLTMLLRSLQAIDGSAYHQRGRKAKVSSEISRKLAWHFCSKPSKV